METKDYNKNIKDFQGDCNNISLVDSLDEGNFSHAGCDIYHIDSNLGNTIYEVNGYNPTTGEIETLGNICGQCLQYIYNGELPDFIKFN